MEATKGTEWFETWFDSPYYHKLYKPRSGAEAAQFIDNFLVKYKPDPSSIFLDLACGRGRLSVALAEKGNFEVIGLDLSEKSIEAAQQLTTEKLSFYRHDMRKLYRTNYFNYVFNFFTSFGYFEKDSDDEMTIQNVYKGLKKGGLFIMDFLNVKPVVENLKTIEIVEREGVTFKIERRADDRFIYKDISFEAEGKSYHFQEKVRAFTAERLQELLSSQGLTVEAVYGNYKLEPFDVDTSPRVILFAKK